MRKRDWANDKAFIMECRDAHHIVAGVAHLNTVWINFSVTCPQNHLTSLGSFLFSSHWRITSHRPQTLYIYIYLFAKFLVFVVPFDFILVFLKHFCLNLIRSVFVFLKLNFSFHLFVHCSCWSDAVTRLNDFKQTLSFLFFFFLFSRFIHWLMIYQYQRYPDSRARSRKNIYNNSFHIWLWLFTFSTQIQIVLMQSLQILCNQA